MDKFEQKKIKKIKPIKNTCYDLLINYIPQPIKNVRAVLKMKLLVFLRQIHLNKQCVGDERN